MGDDSPNRLDGGVGDDLLDGRGPHEAGGAGDLAFGGAGSDVCQGFGSESSCGPERRLSGDSSLAILNQGLDGSSLVVQGDGDANTLRISRSGGAWAISDSSSIAAGDGCEQDRLTTPPPSAAPEPAAP